MDCVKLVLIFMLYPFLCQLAFSSSLRHLCSKDQLHALLQFKQMFTINPNASDYCRRSRTLSWNKSTDCCSWNGVQCDEITRQVIELDLYCSGLQGKFHTTSNLFHLSNLKQLDLSYTDFFGLLISPKFVLRIWTLRGILPERVFHLSNLEDLSLPHNSQTGPIPSNISGLQNLQYLYLTSNYLNGTIPSWIFSLPSLTYLNVRNKTFSGKIQELKSKTLLYVILKQNQLEGPIPKSLLDQQYLQTLILSQNNFSGQIASTIFNSKTLRVLDLGSNHLNGTIPHCLGGMSGLEVLGLNNNNLSGTINTENKLIIINLYGNKLKGKVPTSLTNCRYLKFLDLGNNELNDTFPSWLGGLRDLQILSLRSNKGNLPVSLFENFKAMKIIGEHSGTREYIANDYSGKYANTLIVTTKGLDQELPRVLTTEIIINLSRNRFEGYLPSIIGDLVGLRMLNLSHNGLEGGEIPQQLASLTFLAVINLSPNHLVGCIPKGKQFDTFENSSYQGNDGLRVFPLSKDCGGEDGVLQATTPVELGCNTPHFGLE
ncbi:hypothetical protein P3S67_005710 [Capsicum chacoense]